MIRLLWNAHTHYGYMMARRGAYTYFGRIVRTPSGRYRAYMTHDRDGATEHSTLRGAYRWLASELRFHIWWANNETTI